MIAEGKKQEGEGKGKGCGDQSEIHDESHK